MKLLSYVRDEIERETYYQKISKKLDIPVEILKEKGDRLESSLSRSTYKKRPKTEIVPDHIKKLEDSLLALKLYGGVTKTKIPLDIPEDDTRLDELELVFSADHEGLTDPDYEAEAAELLTRYTSAITKQKIADLTARLADLDDDSEEAEAVLREIMELRQGS